MRPVQRRRNHRDADWRDIQVVRTGKVEELRMRGETASRLKEASSARRIPTIGEVNAARVNREPESCHDCLLRFAGNRDGEPSPNGIGTVGHETGATIRRQTACNKDA